MKYGQHERVVERFLDALTGQDMDRVQSFFADDSEMRRIDGAIIRGQEAISGYLSENDAIDMNWQFVKVEESGPADQVHAQLSGRVLRGGAWRDFQLLGAFAVRGCKITQWH